MVFLLLFFTLSQENNAISYFDPIPVSPDMPVFQKSCVSAVLEGCFP